MKKLSLTSRGAGGAFGTAAGGGERARLNISTQTGLGKDLKMASIPVLFEVYAP